MKIRVTSTFVGEFPSSSTLHSFKTINNDVNFFRDAKSMATDVRNILTNIIKTKGNMSENEAQQFIKKMETQKRYSADVWS